ncbi:MAG: hypothetical protein HQL50_05920 [Magnetococcales bacterium]|nr:hypothetical protein [Magnetococcales bacterium]
MLEKDRTEQREARSINRLKEWANTMQISQFVAQIVGPLYLVVAAGIVLNTKHYRKMMNAFLNNPALIYLGGILALVVGLVLVNHHNTWISDWPVIITILGWLALLKGVVLLIRPEPLLRYSSRWLSEDRPLRVIAMGAALFGLFLTVMGYR